MKIELRSYLFGENEVDKLPGFHGPPELTEEEEDKYDEEGTPIYIEGDRDFLVKELKKWFRRVAQEAWSVGGDDTYYDYYPDNFFVGKQIVEQLPELQEDFDFAYNFAVAVCYGFEGMLDGLNALGITSGGAEEVALRKWSEIMGQKLFVKAHELSDRINSAFGGYWIFKWDKKKAVNWTRLSKAEDYNKVALMMGIPKDLVPYPEKYLEYFRKMKNDA